MCSVLASLLLLSTLVVINSMETRTKQKILLADVVDDVKYDMPAVNVL